MRRFKKLFLFLLILWNAQSYAQVLPLDTVLSRIEKNNPMLKMFDEQISAINNYSQMTKSWMPPTFSTGPWQIPYKIFNQGMWMFTGEQMFPNPAKQKANYNFMQSMSTVEQQGKEAKQNEIFASAKMNYYEWLVLQKKYSITVQTDTLLSYIFKVATNRYTYNKEKLSNIYKAQGDLYQLRNMESMLLSEMAMRKIQLSTLMNVDKNNTFDIDTMLTTKYYELHLTDTSIISKSRSDVQQYDANLNLLKLQEQFEKSKRLPDFGISLSHMQSLGMMPNQYSAMGMVTIPFVPWASKEYRSTIKGLNNTANAISLQRQSLLNETSGMIASLQNQIKSAKEQLINFNDNILPTYFKSYKSSMIAYEQNTEDLFVVLDGLKMYLMANMNQLDQLNNLLKLQVDYEKELEIR